MSTQPSFRERIAQLEGAAKALSDIAATITAEVERMAAAEKRFSARRKSTKASR